MTSDKSPPSPGSIGFAHTTGFFARAIRLGEWLRFRTGDQFNHCFIVTSGGVQTPTGFDPYVIQAEAAGITDYRTLSSVAPGGSYCFVPIPIDVDREKILQFACAQVGQRYGWLSICSIAFKIIMPRWLPIPTLRNSTTWICSSLTGEALRYGGWLHDWPDLFSVVPSELYAALTGMKLSRWPHI